MIATEFTPADLTQTAADLTAKGQAFAVATIVRTVGSTAAKAGAKALIDDQGAMIAGWLGGGCTRAAVKKATIEALSANAPKLITVAPEEVLSDLGVTAGTAVDGVKFARNGCPSKGTVDIFIEPCLPTPTLAIIGGSPVADALRTLAPNLGWTVGEQAQDMVVIATQGQGDLDALKSALTAQIPYVAFVGSAKKYASLSAKLADAGFAPEAIAAVFAPAGLPINAQTPQEIALSILAGLVHHRRTQPEDADA